MNTEEQDAKNGTASSAAPTDATAESSTAKTTNADSSAAGAKEPGSLSEALDRAKLEQPAEEAAAAANDGDGSQAKPSPATQAESGATKTGEAAPKDEQAAKTQTGAQDSDAPFHTRPEWQKAETYFKANPEAEATLKPILRAAFQSETRANDALRKLTPDAEAAAELRRITGGAKEFDAMRQVVRAFSAGDPAVLPILKQMVANIEQSSGNVLSSPDLVERRGALQKQLDAGTIDQAEFKTQTDFLTEVERNRAASKRAKAQSETTQQQAQQREAEGVQRQQVEAINSWESNIRQRDPDFGAVTDVNDPKHGESVADQVFDAMSLKFMNKPNATTDELVQTAQRAYDMARKRLSGPAPRESRPVTSQRSSVTGQQKPRTMREAMDAAKLE